MEALMCLPNAIQEEIRRKIQRESIQEIRLRCKRALYIQTNERSHTFSNIVITKELLQEITQRISGYSLYAFEEALGQGYLTIQGGHRVGFCGRAILEEGKVKTLRYISSLNIRVAHEIKDCSQPWLPYLYEGEELCHIFLISPPACGKTTFLRDLVRQLSNGTYQKALQVSVVDERGEIAPMYQGVPEMDIGQADVQENCPKAFGMRFLLRSMSPDVIVVDELGKAEDFQAVSDLIHAGVRIIATIHGESIEDICKNTALNTPLHTRYIRLSKRCGVGTVEEILDEQRGIRYQRG